MREASDAVPLSETWGAHRQAQKLTFTLTVTLPHPYPNRNPPQP